MTPRRMAGRASKAGKSVGDALATASVLKGSGLLRVMRPDQLAGLGLAAARWGVTPAAGYAAAAVLHANAVAFVDDQGSMTFAELHRRSNALARGLAARGLGSGDAVGVLVRNSRAFAEAVVALSKLGADAVLLNTGFAGPQVAGALDAEQAVALIADGEFASLLADGLRGRAAYWTGADEVPPGGLSLDDVAAADDSDPRPPRTPGRLVILTSGTTGSPKGAARSSAGLDAAVAFLSSMPLKAREVTVIAAPMFHAWGFAHFSLGMLLSSTLVVRRAFDPERVLEDIATHRASALAVVPVMLQRILDLPAEVRARYDTSSLAIVAASGSALPGELATRFMDEYGDVLYNLYGSTEVAYASVAGPADLRAAPGTAGRPPRGTTVRVVGDDGRELPPGETGRIFVGNGLVFGGYTGGVDKERLDGLVSTGDVGRFDPAGRLFIDGRDDDMIVSGGENVFPREIEELLAAHPAIRECVIAGVPDKEFGARLAAYIVLREPGTLNADEVRGLVKERLARYKVPRDVVFLDDLPRNATGKVVARDLPGRSG